MSHLDIAQRDESKDLAQQQIESGNRSIEKRLAQKGKDADPIIDSMVGNSVKNLRGTIEGSVPADKLAEFDTATKNLTDKFNADKKAIMEDDEMSPEVKRSKLTILYNELKERLEDAQGDILSLPAKAKEHWEKMQQEAAEKSKNANERFRQDFLKALSEHALEKVKLAQQEGVKRRSENDKKQLATAEQAGKETDGKLQLLA